MPSRRRTRSSPGDAPRPESRSAGSRTARAACRDSGLAEQPDVVLGHRCHRRGALVGDRHHARCRVVSVARASRPAASRAARLLRGSSARMACRSRAGRWSSSASGLAVQPVGGPVRRDVAAVAPDRAQSAGRRSIARPCGRARCRRVNSIVAGRARLPRSGSGRREVNLAADVSRMPNDTTISVASTFQSRFVLVTLVSSAGWPDWAQWSGRGGRTP